MPKAKSRTPLQDAIIERAEQGARAELRRRGFIEDTQLHTTEHLPATDADVEALIAEDPSLLSDEPEALWRDATRVERARANLHDRLQRAMNALDAGY